MAEQEKLAQLIVQMELQSAAFERGVKDMARKMDRLDDQTKKTNRSFSRMDRTLKKLGKGFAGLAASIGVLGLASATKEAIEFADGLAKTADKVGVSVDALQKLRFAAEQSGLNAQTLDLALQRFARRAGEAAKGTGELVKVFDELGIQTNNVDGTLKSTEELLYEYADAIGEAEGAQEKLRLAFKGFDSEGAALVNLFKDGSGAVRELGDELERAGGLLSEETARAAEVANSKFDKLSTVLKAKVTVAFVEATEAALEFFGVFLDQDAAAVRIREIESEIDRLQKKIESGKSPRSRSADLSRIRELKAELKDVTEQRDKLLGRDSKDEEGVSKTLDPLAREITGIDDLLDGLGAKIRSVRDEAEGLGTQALDAAAPDSLFGSDGLLTGISKSLERAQPVYDFSSSMDTLADIGVTFGEVEEEGNEMFERLIEATDGFAREFTQKLTDALLEGEASFDDFAKNVLKTIADILLSEIFGQFFAAIAGGIKGFFGAPTTTGTDTRIAAYAPMSVPSITREGDVSPSMIVGRVQPSKGFVSTSASPVTVNVNNFGNDEVSVTERKDSNGGIEIDVLIKNTVRQGFANGDFDRALSANFGARRLGY